MLRPIFATLLLATAAVASAQMAPAMINPSDSPLHFISINSTLTDFLHEVTVKNVSGKTITGFQLGVIMTVPSGCGPKEVIAPQQLLSPDSVDIAPGITGTTQSYRYAPATVRSFEQENHARESLTQLTVVSVTFADGTSWTLHRNKLVYDEQQWKQQAALRCQATNSASTN